MDKDMFLEEKAKQIKTGTTTVGLVCTDGIIMASDRRATMGYFIASKDVQKIFQIDEHLSMTVAGSVADAQAVVRLMQAEVKLYRFRHGHNITPKAATTLLSNIMFQYKFYPFYVQLLLGGVGGERGGEIYSLDPLGGVTDEKYVSTGSGSPMAYGYLEDAYVKDGTVKDNLHVAARAIATAMKRDSATGEFVDLVTVTKAGFRRHERAEVEKLLAK
jgi:proteasome beta subunit